MPQEPKAAAPSVQPSRSFLSRMFGSDEFTPEMQQGIDIARKERPDLAPVQPYGFFSRMMNPNALGYASYGNQIYMNPRQPQGTPQDIADTLIHEQEHIGQKRASGYGPSMQFLQSLMPQNLPYYQRPEEMAAFQAEKNRRYSQGRPQTPFPSSQTGKYYSPRDINLPVEKPRKR